MTEECGGVEWAGKFSTKFSGLRETVPDTQDYILWDKIGSSIGGYSGVCEYTANTGTKYRVYRVYEVFVGFANLQRKDPCSVICMIGLKVRTLIV